MVNSPALAGCILVFLLLCLVCLVLPLSTLTQPAGTEPVEVNLNIILSHMLLLLVVQSPVDRVWSVWRRSAGFLRPVFHPCFVFKLSIIMRNYLRSVRTSLCAERIDESNVWLSSDLYCPTRGISFCSKAA